MLLHDWPRTLHVVQGCERISVGHPLEITLGTAVRNLEKLAKAFLQAC